MKTRLKHAIVLAAALLAGGLNTKAQELPAGPNHAGGEGEAATNSFFNQGDLTVSLSPTISSPSLLNARAPHTFGLSYETAYWQTKYTGTGIELGSYDLRNVQFGIIDHITVTENVRLIPFDGDPFLGRFSETLQLGAEQFFQDGSKDVELGLGGEWAFTRTIHGTVKVAEHWRTNPQKDGATATAALSYSY